MEWNELPEGWKVRRLGEVGRYINGRAFKPEEWGDEGLPIIRIQNLTDPTKPFNYCNQPVEAKYYVHEGDLLISWSASLGAFIWDRGDAVLNQHIFRVEVAEGLVDKKFLYFVILHILEGLKTRTHGSTMRHITKRNFEATEIPLPPLPEQRRIVARIEELTERIDAARRLRAEAAEEAAAILPSALAEVFEEVEARGWEKHRLADVALIGTPKGWKPRPKDGKIPFIEMADIDQETGRNSRYVWADYDKVSRGKVRFQPDAILVAKITPCTENNKTALAPEMPTNGGFATTEVFAVHPTGFTNRLYLLAFLRSPQVRFELVSSMTGSTGRQRVPKQVLENLEISLPPLDEQRRIVEYLDALQAKVEAIRRYQEETQQEIEGMTGAVLERAFQGKL